MRLSGFSRVVAAAAALCLVPAAVFTQQTPPAPRTNNAPPKPSGATPRTADGHPDLTGVWNGLGDNLNGVPNQIANNGIVIESDTSARDLHSGLLDSDLSAEHHSRPEQRSGRTRGRPAAPERIKQAHLQA